MHPDPAAIVGRYRQPAYPDRLDTRFVGAHLDRARAGDDAQHFHGQRRHQHVLRREDHRHPTDDAVAVRIDRKDAAAGRRLLD